ncbi:MAG TPA: hypothetical protein VGB98_26570 [Pyrinomonadaceae bacterium]|jgi:hypothetical protein
MQRKLMVFTVAAALMGNSLVAAGQERRERTTVIAPPQGEVEEFFIAQGPGVAPPPQVEMRGDNVMFLATEMSFAGKLVKGAPYSAQAVTETVQQLADGNRIVRKNTAQVYRDGEGRTRREQTLGHIGPYSTSGDVPQTVFINDPVAGVHYILDAAKKTARKLPRVELRVKSGVEDKAAAEAEAARAGERRKLVQTETHKIEIERTYQRVPGPDGPTAPPAPPTVIVTQTGGGEHFMRYSSKYESKTEKLEARSFDGVTAEGTRTTTTIPAGDLGNEQPINIVDERWYSPELQVVVMTRHSDPRAGETTYRLTNISRTEPAAALFQVPSDYTVKDNSAPPGVRRTFRRPAPPPPPPHEN